MPEQRYDIRVVCDGEEAIKEEEEEEEEERAQMAKIGTPTEGGRERGHGALSRRRGKHGVCIEWVSRGEKCSRRRGEEAVVISFRLARR